MAITIMQGDSYPIYVNLNQDGKNLTPDMVEDLELCVGEIWNYRYSAGTLSYDFGRKKWYFFPTQEDTINAEGSHAIYVRPKYYGDPSEVYTYKIDRLTVVQTDCKEVL